MRCRASRFGRLDLPDRFPGRCCCAGGCVDGPRLAAPVAEVLVGFRCCAGARPSARPDHGRADGLPVSRAGALGCCWANRRSSAQVWQPSEPTWMHPRWSASVVENSNFRRRVSPILVPHKRLLPAGYPISVTAMNNLPITSRNIRVARDRISRLLHGLVMIRGTILTGKRSAVTAALCGALADRCLARTARRWSARCHCY